MKSVSYDYSPIAGLSMNACYTDRDKKREREWKKGNHITAYWPKRKDAK